jgi:hypothetical protein
MRDRLFDVVLEHLEVTSGQSLHEAPAVGHDDGHLHDVNIDALVQIELARTRRLRELKAVEGIVEGGGHTDGAFFDVRPGVSLALERRPLQLADLVPIGEKPDAYDTRDG